MTPKAATPATKPEVQPQPAAHAPAPAVAAQPAATPAPTKQEVTLLKLTVALRDKRQIAVKPEMLTTDGKSIRLVIGEGWPSISIGKNGGVVVNELRSYADPFEAAIQGDTLLARQTERDLKRVAGTTAPAAQPASVVAKVVATVVGQPKAATPEVKKETPAQRKAKGHAQVEEKLQASA